MQYKILKVLKILLYIHAFFGFFIIVPMFAGMGFRGEQSWWVGTEILRTYRENGLGDTIFHIYLYGIFYTSISVAIYHLGKYLGTKYLLPTIHRISFDSSTLIPVEASFMVKKCNECSGGKIYPVKCLGLDELEESKEIVVHFIMRCSSCGKTFLLSINPKTKEPVGIALRMDFVILRKGEGKSYAGIGGGRENRMVRIQDNYLSILDAPRLPMVFRGNFSLFNKKRAINPLEALKKAKKLDKSSFVIM